MDVCFGGFSFFSFFLLSFFLSSLSFTVCVQKHLNHRIIVKNEVKKACYRIHIKIQGSNTWFIVEI